MKKMIITSLIVVMVLSLGTAFANPEGIPAGAKMIGHLNIIAAPKDKNINMDGNGGGVIFVDPEGKSKIYLAESGTSDAPGTDADDFVVLDKNATDNDGALLAIPNPDLDPYVIDGDMDGIDVKSAYSIFVRPRGKPGGWATITTCAELMNEGAGLFAMLPNADQREIKNRTDVGKGGVGIAYCSIEHVGSIATLRETGKSTFTNVTAELLTIVFQIDLIDVDDEGVETVFATYLVRVPIFDELLKNEYWEYVQGYDEDTGEWCTLKNLEVRFYNVKTNVDTGEIVE